MRNDYSYTATGAGRLGPIFAVFVPDKQLRGIKKEAAALFFFFLLWNKLVPISFLVCFNENSMKVVFLCKINLNFVIFFSLFGFIRSLDSTAEALTSPTSWSRSGIFQRPWRLVSSSQRDWCTWAKPSMPVSGGFHLLLPLRIRYSLINHGFTSLTRRNL